MIRRTLFDAVLPDAKTRAARRMGRQLRDQLAKRVSPPDRENASGEPFSHPTGIPPQVIKSAACRTELGALVVGDCLSVLAEIPDATFDLVVTSPPYDGQAKYGNGEHYDRGWYEGFFLEVTREILRTLKPQGSFVLNYRSKRHGNERGTLQFELVFWLRRQGFLFCEDFGWGKPSPRRRLLGFASRRPTRSTSVGSCHKPRTTCLRT